MKDVVNFTKALLETATASRDKRLVLKDAKVVGLQCRITEHGTKTFNVYRRVRSGKAERITIGQFPFVTVERARTEALQIISKLSLGESPAETVRIAKAEMTFEELFFDYLNRHAKVSKKTWKDDLAKYKLHLKKPLGRLKISEVTRATLVSLQAEILVKVREKDKIREENLQKKISSGYTNRVLALISVVFSWAISISLCEHNPAKGVKRYREKSRERFLQADEMPKFFDAVAAEENEDVRDFVYLALFTGARKSNVLSMAWKDICIERKEWVIPHTKNGSPLTVSLTEEVLQILRKRSSNGSDFVLAGIGKNGHVAEPRKGWQRILKKAGINDLRIHDLRRTFGSWQAKTGASLAIIGKSLGHKSLQSTTIYARLDMEPVRLSMETATKAILQASRRKRYGSLFNFAAQKRKILLATFADLLG